MDSLHGGCLFSSLRLSFFTYWMLLVVNYSWSLGTNKFLYQAKKYIFPLEIIPRGTYSLLTIFPPCGSLTSPPQCFRKDAVSGHTN